MSLIASAKFECEYKNCKFSTYNRTDFRRHSFVHIICKLCNQTFEHTGLLKTHMKKYHDDVEGNDGKQHKMPSSNVASNNLTVQADMENLDEQINSMIELGENVIIWGTGKRRTVICKMCGKEDVRGNLRKHIESAHIVGASHPCSVCGKISRSRGGLRTHIWSMHHQKNSPTS